MTILSKLLEIKSNISIALGKLLQAYLNVLEEVKGFISRGLSKIYSNAPEKPTDFNPSNAEFAEGNAPIASEKLLQTHSNILEGEKVPSRTISRGLSKIYSNTPKKPTGLNISNENFVQRGDVAYALSYKDNGDGKSEVQLICSPSQLSELITHNIGKNIQNERKDQLYLSLLKNSGETDEIGIFFPTDKGLSLSVYEAKYSVNTSSFEYMGSARLQENIKNHVSSIGSYSDLQATTLDNGDKFVIARKGKDLVSWYIKPGEKGKLEVLAGTNGIIERQLLKLSNSGDQFVLNGNTLLYSRESTEIIGNEALEKTDIISLDIAEVAEKARKGEGTEEYLFGDGKGQINEKPFFSSENVINFLQLVERGEEGDVIALLEEDKSSNKQRLHLLGLSNGELLSDFPIDKFNKGTIKQLYVKDNNQGGFTITAISKKNVITFDKNNFEESPSVTKIPVSDIKSPSDFMRIIRGEFTPIANSTVNPNTTDKEETSPVTDKPTTQGVGSTSGSTDLITASATPAEKSTVKSTTVKPTETTETDEGHSSSTESTNAPTVFTRGSSTPFTLNTPFFPETSSPGPTQFSLAGPGGSNHTGIAIAFLSVVGILTFVVVGAYKCVQRYCLENAGPDGAEPKLNLSEMDYTLLPDDELHDATKRGGDSGSDELFNTNDIPPVSENNPPENSRSSSLSASGSETLLEGISIGSSSESETKLDVDSGSSQSSSPSHVSTPENSSNSSFSEVRPESWLQRVMFCCGISSRPSSDIELNSVLASGCESPGSSRSPSSSRT